MNCEKGNTFAGNIVNNVEDSFKKIDSQLNFSDQIVQAAKILGYPENWMVNLSSLKGEPLWHKETSIQHIQYQYALRWVLNKLHAFLTTSTEPFVQDLPWLFITHTLFHITPCALAKLLLTFGSGSDKITLLGIMELTLNKLLSVPFTNMNSLSCSSSNSCQMSINTDEASREENLHITDRPIKRKHCSLKKGSSKRLCISVASSHIIVKHKSIVNLLNAMSTLLEMLNTLSYSNGKGQSFSTVLAQQHIRTVFRANSLLATRLLKLSLQIVQFLRNKTKDIYFTVSNRFLKNILTIWDVSFESCCYTLQGQKDQSPYNCFPQECLLLACYILEPSCQRKWINIGEVCVYSFPSYHDSLHRLIYECCFAPAYQHYCSSLCKCMEEHKWNESDQPNIYAKYQNTLLLDTAKVCQALEDSLKPFRDWMGLHCDSMYYKKKYGSGGTFVAFAVILFCLAIRAQARSKINYSPLEKRIMTRQPWADFVFWVIVKCIGDDVEDTPQLGEDCSARIQTDENQASPIFREFIARVLNSLLYAAAILRVKLSRDSLILIVKRYTGLLTKGHDGINWGSLGAVLSMDMSALTEPVTFKKSSVINGEEKELVDLDDRLFNVLLQANFADVEKKQFIAMESVVSAWVRNYIANRRLNEFTMKWYDVMKKGMFKADVRKSILYSDWFVEIVGLEMRNGDVLPMEQQTILERAIEMLGDDDESLDTVDESIEGRVALNRSLNIVILNSIITGLEPETLSEVVIARVQDIMIRLSRRKGGVDIKELDLTPRILLILGHVLNGASIRELVGKAEKFERFSRKVIESVLEGDLEAVADEMMVYSCDGVGKTIGIKEWVKSAFRLISSVSAVKIRFAQTYGIAQKEADGTAERMLTVFEYGIKVWEEDYMVTLGEFWVESWRYTFGYVSYRIRKRIEGIMKELGRDMVGQERGKEMLKEVYTTKNDGHERMMTMEVEELGRVDLGSMFKMFDGLAKHVRRRESAYKQKLVEKELRLRIKRILVQQVKHLDDNQGRMDKLKGEREVKEGRIEIREFGDYCRAWALEGLSKKEEGKGRWESIMDVWLAIIEMEIEWVGKRSLADGVYEDLEKKVVNERRKESFVKLCSFMCELVRKDLDNGYINLWVRGIRIIEGELMIDEKMKVERVLTGYEMGVLTEVMVLSSFWQSRSRKFGEKDEDNGVMVRYIVVSLLVYLMERMVSRESIRRLPWTMMSVVIRGMMELIVQGRRGGLKYEDGMEYERSRRERNSLEGDDGEEEREMEREGEGEKKKEDKVFGMINFTRVARMFCRCILHLVRGRNMSTNRGIMRMDKIQEKVRSMVLWIEMSFPFEGKEEESDVQGREDEDGVMMEFKALKKELNSLMATE